MFILLVSPLLTDEQHSSDYVSCRLTQSGRADRKMLIVFLGGISMAQEVLTTGPFQDDPVILGSEVGFCEDANLGEQVAY